MYSIKHELYIFRRKKTNITEPVDRKENSVLNTHTYPLQTHTHTHTGGIKKGLIIY